jgi:inorganic phosphate transporter, PiT family
LLESISDLCDDVANLIEGAAFKTSKSRRLALMGSVPTTFWVVAMLVALAIAFNFMNGFHDAANAIATGGKGIVLPGVVDHRVVFSALIGAIFWNVVTWRYGTSSSSSHALIGGNFGAVVATAGADRHRCVEEGAFVFVSPLLGFMLGSLPMVPVARRCRRASPLRVDSLFRRLHLVSAGL